jgi:hypothetical protein
MKTQKAAGIANCLRSLACAELTFCEAQGLAELLKTIDHTKSPLFFTSPMMAGVVVTYARNFTESSGMRVLSSDYSSFSDSDLQQTHNSLMDTRHKIYAHRDYTELSQMADPVNPERKGHDVFITFHDEFTGFDFDVASPQQDPATLSDIINLCMFQRTRIAAELKKMIEHCLPEDHEYQVGVSYKIGEDFPQSKEA